MTENDQSRIGDLPSAAPGELPRNATSPSGHTPGPWRWYGNTKNHDMYLATPRGGRTLVMAFMRWGMSGAQPAFYVDGLREPASKLVRYEVNYRADVSEIDHPDARLIAAAPELLAALKSVRLYVAASTEASHLMDGFSIGDDGLPRRNRQPDTTEDRLLQTVEAAIAKAEGVQP